LEKKPMADTRYKDQGYSVKLLEDESGAYLTISRHDTIVAEIAVGFFPGGHERSAQVVVKRFKANELRDVHTVLDFEG